MKSKITIPENFDQRIDTETNTFHVMTEFDNPEFEIWCTNNNIGYTATSRTDVIKSHFHVFCDMEMRNQIFLRNETCQLTAGGNLLRKCHLGWYFSKTNGEFLRQCSENEAEFLSSNALTIELPKSPDHPTEFPIWNFLAKVIAVDDNSNYRPETSCNGGDYAYWENRHWFCATVNGLTVFRYITEFGTTAEFSYDELDGRFQSDLGIVSFLNISGSTFYIRTQAGKLWNEEEYRWEYDIIDTFEKYSEIGSFDQLWKSTYKIIPSRYEDDSEPITAAALTFTDKREILSKLKSFGVDLRKGRRTKRKLIKSNRR